MPPPSLNSTRVGTIVFPYPDEAFFCLFDGVLGDRRVGSWHGGPAWRVQAHVGLGRCEIRVPGGAGRHQVQ